MYKHYDQFEKFFRIKQNVLGDGAEHESLLDSLDYYIEKHKIELDGEECLNTVTEAGHFEAIKAIVDTFFFRKDTKKFCVWFHGKTSSGKSTIIKMMMEIFSC